MYFETKCIDIDKVFIIAITMFADTADIGATWTDSLYTPLDEGAYLLKTFLYFLCKIFYLPEFMSLYIKDPFYVACDLIVLNRILMDRFWSIIMVHYFLINLNTDNRPRVTEEAAVIIASTP